MWTIDSGRPRPIIGLTANIHGDECTGVVVLNRILEKVHLENGQLRIFPSLNPEGLRETRRESPDMGRDLNRLFPDCLQTNPEVHYELSSVWRALQDPRLDFVVDIHSDSGLAMPYVLMDRYLFENNKLIESMLEWADTTRLFVLWEYAIPDYRRFQLQRSLSGAVLNSLQVPCLTLEVGRRRHVDMKDVQIALSVVGRLLVHAGCVSAQSIEELGWIDSVEPYPQVFGVGVMVRLPELVGWLYQCSIGNSASRGDSIASIVDLKVTLEKRYGQRNLCGNSISRHRLGKTVDIYLYCGCSRVLLAESV